MRGSKAKPSGKGGAAKAVAKAKPAAKAKPGVAARPAPSAGAFKSGGAPRAKAKGSPRRPPGAGRRTGRTTTTPAVRVAVRELDPQRKCGDGTSVQFLYRVDETVDGRATAHLVFFDRHGWYCEHGRTCPAVAYARKHNGQFARVS